MWGRVSSHDNMLINKLKIRILDLQVYDCGVKVYVYGGGANNPINLSINIRGF